MFDAKLNALQAARIVLHHLSIHDQSELGYNLRSSASVLWQLDEAITELSATPANCPCCALRKVNHV